MKLPELGSIILHWYHKFLILLEYRVSNRITYITCFKDINIPIKAKCYLTYLFIKLVVYETTFR